MKIEYFPQTDTLGILLLRKVHSIEVQDSSDPDITLLFDKDNRIAEIVIEHASKRTDLESVRARLEYEEVVSDRP